MVPRAYLILPSQTTKGTTQLKVQIHSLLYSQSIAYSGENGENGHEKTGRSHDHDDQSLVHGRPGVVDDDQADVGDDKSSPGTVEELN